MIQGRLHPAVDTALCELLGECFPANLACGPNTGLLSGGTALVSQVCVCVFSVVAEDQILLKRGVEVSVVSYLSQETGVPERLDDVRSFYLLGLAPGSSYANYTSVFMDGLLR